MYCGKLKVLQYFRNIFSFFFQIQQKQPSIQLRVHRAAHFKATFLPVIWFNIDTSSCHSNQRTVFQKFLPPPLLVVDVLQAQEVSRRSEQMITQRKLDPDNQLGVASVWFSQVSGMQSTPSLPSLPGPLWPGVVAPERV